MFSILDAGCGAGFLHQHIINHKMPHAHLYAFDLSSEMVKRAAARMKKYLARD
jgi:ubiquinone/menaquinone biosynthesis C-methylase UbiE